LLVIGGSLGARTINQTIEKMLPWFASKHYQLIWQTGKGYDPIAKAAVDALGNDHVRQRAFIERMDLAYAMADSVVSRAGAISVSELCLAAKPCIFVPSPNVAEDHQTKNAQALVQNNAALLVRDAEAQSTLQEAVAKLMGDPALRDKLSVNIRKLAHTDAATAIAKEVLELAESQIK
jgi:UDP-N-acetylglucosamine--N-acetylmuramyl-(pentapeptide) pyrophosphoryl-undecaprenol N-acetylglucosamine transferase